MKLSVPKGTKDILSNEMKKYRQIENIFSDVCNNYGYGEITTPVFEFTELFQRGVGETTDVVSKEMYTFLDKGKRSLTLRPEGTAGVVRSYINNGMASLPQPVKLFYMEKMYRYENVQKGRYREFTQIGLEAFGSNNAVIDVEVISLVNVFFEKLGISDLKLMINSIGCKTCRGEYNIKLTEYYKDYIDGLCSDCKVRYTKNPLRLLDCKVDNCQKVASNAPVFIDNLCEECKDDFTLVKQGLENLSIDFTINKTLVRGLDYYTKTVFEFVSDNVGTQGTICAGGRYDNLVELLGGKETPGIGFAMGVERILMELESRDINMVNEVFPKLYIATLGDNAYSFASKLTYELRKQNIFVDIDVTGRSLKAQMKNANKKNARYAIVLGDDEITSNKCKIKNMATGYEEEIFVDDISKTIIENKA